MKTNDKLIKDIINSIKKGDINFIKKNKDENIDWETLLLDNLPYVDKSFFVNYIEQTITNTKSLYKNIITNKKYQLNLNSFVLYNLILDKEYEIVNLFFKNNPTFFLMVSHMFLTGLNSNIKSKNELTPKEIDFYNLLKKIIETDEIIVDNLGEYLLNSKRSGFLLFPYYLEKKYKTCSATEQVNVIKKILVVLNIIHEQSEPIIFPETTLFQGKKIKSKEFQKRMINYIFKNRNDPEEEIMILRNNNNSTYFIKSESQQLIFLINHILKKIKNFDINKITNLTDIICLSKDYDLLKLYTDNNGKLYDKNSKDILSTFINLNNIYSFDPANSYYLLSILNHSESEVYKIYRDFFFHLFSILPEESQNDFINNKWDKIVGNLSESLMSDTSRLITEIESLKLNKQVKSTEDDLKNIKKRI